jgi:DNA invertase Pin-like site-specific DNA recombinase
MNREKRRQFTPEENKKFIEMYESGEFTAEQIGQKFGITRQSVYAKVFRYKIEKKQKIAFKMIHSNGQKVCYK